MKRKESEPIDACSCLVCGCESAYIWLPATLVVWLIKINDSTDFPQSITATRCFPHFSSLFFTNNNNNKTIEKRATERTRIDRFSNGLLPSINALNIIQEHIDDGIPSTAITAKSKLTNIDAKQQRQQQKPKQREQRKEKKSLEKGTSRFSGTQLLLKYCFYIHFVRYTTGPYVLSLLVCAWRKIYTQIVWLFSTSNKLVIQLDFFVWRLCVLSFLPCDAICWSAA